MNNTTRKRIEEFENGDRELPDMKMSEFLELSLLSMFNNEEVVRESPVFYKGSYYNLHMCITFVSPAEEIERLKRKQ